MSKSSILAFIFGAAIGSVITWKLVKTKYEQRADEEISEMKEYYSEKMEKKEAPAEEATEAPASDSPKKAANVKYKQIIEENNYTNDTAEGANDMSDKPYVISPDEFGEEDGYACVSLNYYADGVLTDDQDMPIEDADTLVGTDFADHFGEYEDDSVFIRNENESTDYEILRDLRNFADMF